MKNLELKTRFRSASIFFVAVLALIVITTSCEKEEEILVPEQPMQDEAQLDIAATLEKITEDPDFFDFVYEGDAEIESEDALKSGKYRYKRPTFGNLLYALIKTDLFWTVVRNELTVFAPSDKAFKTFLKENGFRSIRQVPKDLLKSVLLYHVVEGKVKSGDLENGFVPTLNGAAVKIDLTSGVMVNDATVEFADIHALNGVIHVIDKVLFPPTKNIVEIAGGDPNFSILVDALKAADKLGNAGFVSTLSSAGDFTVFAPTNAAFANLLNALGVSDLDGVVSKIGVDGLTNVLKYHVVAGKRVYSSDLSDGDVVETFLSGSTFEVDFTEPAGIIDFNRNKAPFAANDIQASNGVIHVIEEVILPELP